MGQSCPKKFWLWKRNAVRLYQLIDKGLKRMTTTFFTNEGVDKLPRKNKCEWRVIKLDTHQHVALFLLLYMLNEFQCVGMYLHVWGFSTYWKSGKCVSWKLSGNSELLRNFGFHFYQIWSQDSVQPEPLECFQGTSCGLYRKCHWASGLSFLCSSQNTEGPGQAPGCCEWS